MLINVVLMSNMLIKKQNHNHFRRYSKTYSFRKFHATIRFVTIDKALFGSVLTLRYSFYFLCENIRTEATFCFTSHNFQRHYFNTKEHFRHPSRVHTPFCLANTNSDWREVHLLSQPLSQNPRLMLVNAKKTSQGSLSWQESWWRVINKHRTK